MKIGMQPLDPTEMLAHRGDLNPQRISNLRIANWPIRRLDLRDTDQESPGDTRLTWRELGADANTQALEFEVDRRGPPPAPVPQPSTDR